MEQNQPIASLVGEICMMAYCITSASSKFDVFVSWHPHVQELDCRVTDKVNHADFSRWFQHYIHQPGTHDVWSDPTEWLTELRDNLKYLFVHDELSDAWKEV